PRARHAAYLALAYHLFPLLMQPPPRSTLFPYTTLFRSNGGQYRPTNHRRTTVQDPYAAPADHAGFVDGWFVASMPDLNQRNPRLDRKSTRLNSSHVKISYAVFCLEKKKPSHSHLMHAVT